jgi:hypothetical protein
MQMHKLRYLTLALIVVITAGVFSAEAQAKETSATEKMILAFYDSYADDLRQHRREAIVDRYDRRGVYLMGNGSKRLQTFEQVKDAYMTKWTGPKSFEWKDLSVDVISKDAAAVIGTFVWTTASGESFNYSYTGLLVRQKGEWRIRIEDESSAPTKQ